MQQRPEGTSADGGSTSAATSSGWAAETTPAGSDAARQPVAPIRAVHALRVSLRAGLRSGPLRHLGSPDARQAGRDLPADGRGVAERVDQVRAARTQQRPGRRGWIRLGGWDELDAADRGSRHAVVRIPRTRPLRRSGAPVHAFGVDVPARLRADVLRDLATDRSDRGPSSDSRATTTDGRLPGVASPRSRRTTPRSASAAPAPRRFAPRATRRSPPATIPHEPSSPAAVHDDSLDASRGTQPVRGMGTANRGDANAAPRRASTAKTSPTPTPRQIAPTEARLAPRPPAAEHRGDRRDRAHEPEPRERARADPKGAAPSRASPIASRLPRAEVEHRPHRPTTLEARTRSRRQQQRALRRQRQHVSAEEQPTPGPEAVQAVDVRPRHGRFERRDDEYAHREQAERPAVRRDAASERGRGRPAAGRLQVRAGPRPRGGQGPGPERRAGRVDLDPEPEGGEREGHQGRAGGREDGHRDRGAGRRQTGGGERGSRGRHPRRAPAGARRQPQEPDRQGHRDEPRLDRRRVGRGPEDRRALHGREHIRSERQEGGEEADLDPRPEPVHPDQEEPESGEQLADRDEGDERDRRAHRGPADDPPGVGGPPRTPGGRRRAHPRRSATRSATCEGLRPTDAPTASRASALAAAVPLEPVTIAPAWPMRLPGGASKPAM